MCLRRIVFLYSVADICIVTVCETDAKHAPIQNDAFMHRDWSLLITYNMLASPDEQTTIVVTSDVAASRGGDERGLLSLAFHPDYKKNGKLYVSYTTNQERWAIGPHDHILRIVEYTVSRKNPHQVDMRTTRPFLEVAELHRKHLGGQVFFGADGFLYVILGDGMITIDDMEEMDGLSDFTGSILRLDVDTDFCHVPYSIPQSNPHFNSTNQPPEIFAHGLHNPGRCAVDRHPTEVNINLTILCSDSNEKNRSSARIIQIIKGKDYGQHRVHFQDNDENQQ
ncbi:hypothetical protein Chor_001053 [Crotalus horridus]